MENIAEICDLCKIAVSGDMLFTVDKCKIPKKGGGLIIQETQDICPACMEKRAADVFKLFK